MSTPALHELLARARVYDLGQAYWPGMPVHPFDPPFQFYLYRYHEYVEKDLGKIEPGFGDAISLLITSMHSGTHFDVPVHMSQDYKVQGIDIRPYPRDIGFVDLPEPLRAVLVPHPTANTALPQEVIDRLLALNRGDLDDNALRAAKLAAARAAR